MIAFKVILNGKTLTLAGAEDLSVLGATVTLVGKLGNKSKKSSICKDLYISGGTSRGEGQDDEYLRWAKKKLEIGDKIEIKIIETDKARKPVYSSLTEKKSKEEDKAVRERERFEYAKHHYYKLKKKYEPEE